MPIELIPQNQNEPSTGSQFITAVLANCTGIASGVAFGFTAIIIPSSKSINNSSFLNYDQISWIASVIFLTNVFGCGIGGIISDAWGRKYCLLIGNAICFFGWILIVIAYYCFPPYQFIVLLIGRLITGFSIGSASVTTVVYTAETSNLKFRPMFTTWTVLTNTIGIFLVYLLGYCFQGNWGIVSIITAMLPLISFITITFCLPESEAWLNSKTETVEETPKVQFTEADEVTTLLGKEENVQSKLKNTFRHQLIFRRTCLIPTVIMVSYFFFLNFSGYFIIIAYASDFVILLKIPLDPYLTMSSFAVVRLIGSIFISIFSKNMGRRYASIMSGTIMTLSVFGIAIYLQSVSTIPDEKLKLLFWIPTVLMWIYILACTIGFCTIPFAMVGEIFPINIRGVASGISLCLHNIFTFVAVKMYPFFLQIFGMYELLLFFGVISLIGTIFIIFFLPETKGKTLKEIEDYFANCTSIRRFTVLQ